MPRTAPSLLNARKTRRQSLPINAMAWRAGSDTCHNGQGFNVSPFQSATLEKSRTCVVAIYRADAQPFISSNFWFTIFEMRGAKKYAAALMVAALVRVS